MYLYEVDVFTRYSVTPGFSIDPPPVDVAATVTLGDYPNFELIAPPLLVPLAGMLCDPYQ